jgi:hypothetical protein
MTSTCMPSIIASIRGLANRVNDRAGPGRGE